jgi:hypothetical protein
VRDQPPSFRLQMHSDACSADVMTSVIIDSHQMCRVKESEKDIQKHASKTKEWHKDRKAKMAAVEKHADKA